MNTKKKIFIIILIFFITLLFQQVVFAEELNIYSPTAVLMDANSGEILYDKNAGYPMFPASTTKILTAIIAIEKCDLNEKVTASESAVASIKSGYTNAKIQAGETLTIKDLLYALLLKSANEAANIIAEHISGSVDEFANLMNEKATEIGCKTTHFVNANGIHNDDHYTTAEDLALMTKYSLKNKTFRKIFCAKQYTLPATEQYPSEDRILANTNSLMHEDKKYYYPYAIGGKTGFTTQAKNCLVCLSKKNNLELISVVLHAESTEDGRSARYIDTITLLEYGNNNYKSESIVKEGDVVKDVKVANASRKTRKLNVIAKDSIFVTLPNSEKLKISSSDINVEENLEAPIEAGMTIGKATYKVGDKTYETELVAESNVELASNNKQGENEQGIPVMDFIILGIVIVGIVVFVVFKNRGDYIL